MAVTESAITFPPERKFMSAYITIEIAPIATVATVGVRYFLCMVPNASGTALYTLIESTVRAVGRMTYTMSEIAPIATVATVGVRYFLCMVPNASGTALYTLIESTVRAVGRMTYTM